MGRVWGWGCGRGDAEEQNNSYAENNYFEDIEIFLGKT
jgi:hypothetical protein